MNVNGLQKLKVEECKTGDTNLILDETRLTKVMEYKIESSTSGTAELTVKLLVKFP